MELLRYYRKLYGAIEILSQTILKVLLKNNDLANESFEDREQGSIIHQQACSIDQQSLVER